MTPRVSYKRCVATCAGGVEEILAGEISSMDAVVDESGSGFVGFRGSPRLLVRATRELRTASRVLLILDRGTVRDPDAIYRRVSRVEWERLIPTEATFAVAASTTNRSIGDARYIAMRTKDAIVDRQRLKLQRRSSIDRRNPDIRIVVHVGGPGSRPELSVSLDASLRPLHERGYRGEAGEAPLRETVAAAMLLAAGGSDLKTGLILDPFGGSGTIAIEAALLYRRISPGALGLRRYGWERWRWFHDDAVEEKRGAEGAPADPIPIVYAEGDPKMIEIAKRNARRAGIEQDIVFIRADFRELPNELRERGFLSERRGTIVTNPPYGERLASAGLESLYAEVTQSLKRDFSGWNAWFLTPTGKSAPRIGLRSAERRPMYNGGIPCRLDRYEIFPTSGKAS